MCRLLAYLGDEIHLSKLLFEPEHSLEKQAWQPKELREAKLNADGFGFAWYNLQHGDLMPACYRSTLPIWNDANLQDLSQTLKFPLWMAYVRSATVGLGLSMHNTQPFLYREWSFLHNGYIFDFKGKTQHQLIDILDDCFLHLVHGNTDSEYIFALLMQYLDTRPPLDALRSCARTLEQLTGDKRSLLNIVISNGEQVYSLRHAINGLCPSLYYTNANKNFGEGNQLLVSERLDNDDSWLAIDDHKLLALHRNTELEIHDL